MEFPSLPSLFMLARRIIREGRGVGGVFRDAGNGMLRARWARNRPVAPALSLSSTTQKEKAPNLDFNDAIAAYKSKTTLELIRALVVFYVSTQRWLVSNARELLAFGNKVSPSLTQWVVKETFFAHFCAGTDEESIQPTLKQLQSLGVGAVLDYAAEADVEEESVELSLEDRDQLQARTYDYEGERQCDENMRITLRAICASQETSGDMRGFAAVKVTSLGKPELLQHVSQVLFENRLMFDRYFMDERGHVPADVTKDEFGKALQRLRGLSLTDSDIDSLFDQMDQNEDGKVNRLEWVNFMDIQTLGAQPVVAEPSNPLIMRHQEATELSDEDRQRLANMLERARTIAMEAASRGVTVMVDAEQSYLQGAIDHAVLAMQREFNKELPVVYQTFQAYRVECKRNLEEWLERARLEQFCFGAKLVRGAYLEQERKRAKELEYDDPIHPTKEATDQCYNECASILINAIASGNGVGMPTEAMIASHNEDSVQRAVKLLQDLEIDSAKGGLSFGQLLGMCDHITMTLAQHNFSAWKYVPWGPVDQVIPYLVRRGQENSSILQGTGPAKERRMLREALWHRLSSRG